MVLYLCLMYTCADGGKVGEGGTMKRHGTVGWLMAVVALQASP